MLIVNFQNRSPCAVNGSFVRGVMTMVLGTGAAQAVCLLALPLVTRLYHPADFGTFSVCAAAVSLVYGIASLCYQRAIPLCPDDESASAVLVLSTGLSLGLTGLATVVMLVAASVFASWSTFQTLRHYAWFFAVAVFLLSTADAMAMWVVRQKAFSHLARSRFVQGTSMVVGQLVLGFASLGAQGLLLADALSRALAVGCLLPPILASRFSSFPLLRPWFRRTRQAAVEHRRFALFATPAVLLNRSTAALPALLVAAFYGPTVAGCLVFAERVLGAPVTLIGESVAQVYLSEAAQLKRTRPEGLLPLVAAAAWRLFLIGLVPASVALIAGPSLFSFAFGADWSSAGVFARYLVPAVLLQFVVSPLSHTLNVLDRQDLQLLWDAIFFVLRTGSLCIAHCLSWAAPEAILGYSFAMFSAYGLQIVLISYVLRRTSAALAPMDQVAGAATVRSTSTDKQKTTATMEGSVC